MFMANSVKLHRWSDVPAEQLNPLLRRQFVSGEQSTIATIELKKGCIVPTHAHHNEQISSIVSGALRFTFDPQGTAESITVHAGEVLVIPPHVPHSAEALEDTVNIDFFSPVRSDWVSGDDAYLRGDTGSPK